MRYTRADWFRCGYGPRTELVELPIEDPLPTVTIHAVLRADAPLTVPAQRLLDAFVQQAQEYRAQQAQEYRAQPAQEYRAQRAQEYRAQRAPRG